MDSNLKQQAYEMIKGKILNCEFAPKSYLSENMLIESTGFGRTPIRDALGRLEQEGLINIQAKRGIWVADLTLRDVYMIFEYRKLVEAYAIREHGNKINKTRLSDIVHEMKKCDVTETIDRYTLDDQFHQELVVVTKNTYILMAHRALGNQMHRARVISLKEAGQLKRVEESIREHETITEALFQEDYSRAEKELLIHLNNSYNSVLSMLLADSTMELISLVDDYSSE